MHTTTRIRKSHYFKAWILTTRPKTLILSIVPFVVGTLFALKLVDVDWELMFFAMLSAFFIQIGTNFINDVYDFKNNADRPTRLGPKRGIQSGILTVSQVFFAGVTCFGVALLLGIPLVMKGGALLLAVLILSVFFGFLYTAGSKSLAYNGFGELFVLLFFGLVSTGAAFYLQTGFITKEILLLGFQLGCLASLPVAINNLRDIEDDAVSNKKTLAVRFGKTFARIEITILGVIPFLFTAFFGSWQLLLLPALALPLAFIICKHIWTEEPSPSFNTYLGLSILLYVCFSLAVVTATML